MCACYPKYYCDRLCNALNFPHCRSIFFKKHSEKAGISAFPRTWEICTGDTMCSLWLISFPMPDLLSWITRHPVGAFCFKFLNAKCLLAALSGPFYFLDHSECNDVRKCARIHTHAHTHTHRYKYMNIMLTHQVPYQTT